MLVQENISLGSLNSFGIKAKARQIVFINHEDDLKNLLPEIRGKRVLILGEGTNTLFSNDFEGVILKVDIKGMNYGTSNEGFQKVRVGGGENWHSFVMDTLEKNLRGLENLSLIPGSVGASPIQNIGAYGVEVSEFIDSVEGFNTESGEKQVFEKGDCQFEYRSSIFKKRLRDKFIVTHVNFSLEKKWDSINTSYQSLKTYLEEKEVQNPTPHQVSNAVIAIRKSKLPDPNVIGNAGSFFKNPVISEKDFDELRKQFPTIPGYMQGDRRVKVYAGWLIENLGWKGKALGNAGVHKDQALVLVNLGAAQGNEIKELAEKLMEEVNAKYGIRLEPEVRIIE